MKRRSKSERLNEIKKSDKNSDNIEYIYNDRKEDQKKKSTFKIFFVLSIVNFIPQISGLIYYVIIMEERIKITNLNIRLIFSIFSVVLFSILILHTKFYIHHFFSILIDIICLIIIAVIDIKNLIDNGNIAESAIFLLIILINEILYSLSNIIAKILFLYYYISTFALLLYKSIFHFVYLIIFSIPFIFIKIYNKNREERVVFLMIIEFFEEKINILIFISYMFISFFYNNLFFKIIDLFSPNHFTISRIFEGFGVFVIDLILNGVVNKIDFVIKLITFILLILSSFIYNEFLVINICGLASKTNLFLEYNSQSENSSRNESEMSITLSIENNEENKI